MRNLDLARGSDPPQATWVEWQNETKVRHVWLQSLHPSHDLVSLSVIADGHFEGSEGVMASGGYPSKPGLTNRLYRTQTSQEERREIPDGMKQQGQTHITGLMDEEWTSLAIIKLRFSIGAPLASGWDNYSLCGTVGVHLRAICMHGPCLLNTSHHPHPCGNHDVPMHFQTPSMAPLVENHYSNQELATTVGFEVRLRKALKTEGKNLALILKTMRNDQRFTSKEYVGK